MPKGKKKHKVEEEAGLNETKIAQVQMICEEYLNITRKDFFGAIAEFLKEAGNSFLAIANADAEDIEDDEDEDTSTEESDTEEVEDDTEEDDEEEEDDDSDDDESEDDSDDDDDGDEDDDDESEDDDSDDEDDDDEDEEDDEEEEDDDDDVEDDEDDEEDEEDEEDDEDEDDEEDEPRVYTRKELKEMTAKKLKSILEDLDASTSGTKDKLIANVIKAQKKLAKGK